MPPKPYYQVKTSAYLFGKTDTPEEKVRQWALFELLSTYCINISSLSIEKSVKIGSKTYYADIVIERNNAPYIVIECKEQNDSRSELGLQQAQSYADNLRAYIAVFTNGAIWQVSRKINNDWVAIPDFETFADRISTADLSQLIRYINAFKPLFYWLHRSIPAEKAKDFFDNLQVLFHVHANFFDNRNTNLHWGLEHILRVVNPDIESPYSHEKLRIANDYFNDYLKEINHQREYSPHFADTSKEYLQVLEEEMTSLVRNSLGIGGYDCQLTRLSASILRYFRQCVRQQEYLDVPESLVDDFQLLIEPIFLLKFGIILPTKFDDLQDLQELCGE